MKHIGDTMRQSVEQCDRKQRAGRLRRLRDLIRKKRLYGMANKLYKKRWSTPFGLGMDEGIKTELDRMYKESEQALEQLIESLGNDELIQEIQKRLALSDRELDALTISDDEVERLINSPLVYRKNNAETTPKRPS